MSKPETIGETLRRLRQGKGEPLRKVAAFLEIDQAILSKIERGERKATRKQVEKLAEYFGVEEKKLMVTWLSDKFFYELQDENIAEEALKLAEEKVRYARTVPITINDIQSAVKRELKKFPMITRAWLFGSYARNEHNYKSDVDLMIDVPSEKDFSLFDQFGIQHELERALKRKVDLVLKGGIKPFASESAQRDMKLIYERS